MSPQEGHAPRILVEVLLDGHVFLGAEERVLEGGLGLLDVLEEPADALLAAELDRGDEGLVVDAADGDFDFLRVFVVDLREVDLQVRGRVAQAHAADGGLAVYDAGDAGHGVGEVEEERVRAVLSMSRAMPRTTGSVRMLRARAAGPSVSPTETMMPYLAHISHERASASTPPTVMERRATAAPLRAFLRSIVRMTVMREPAWAIIFSRRSPTTFRGLRRDVEEDDFAVVEPAHQQHVAHDLVDEFVRSADEDDALPADGPLVLLVIDDLVHPCRRTPSSSAPSPWSPSSASALS